MSDEQERKLRAIMEVTMKDVPEYDEFVRCGRPDCEYDNAEPVVGLYGLLGGGMGPYTVCSKCGDLLTKSQDAEILCDSHEVEIKDASTSDKATPTDDSNGESGGSVPGSRE